MEITLEKIELVKDRTGVSYREAKDALEACDGSVVDAIIAIEENIDDKKSGKTGEYVKASMAKVKEFVNKGNITKISVKKGDDSIVNIPVNVGIVGAVLAPWGVIAAAIAAFGFKCRVELTTDDGKVIDISEKVGNVAETVKEKSSVVVDEIKEKGAAVVGGIKEKAPDYVEKVKDAGTDAFNNLKEKAPDYVEKVKDAGTDAFNNLKEKAPDYVEKVKDAGTDAFNNIKEKAPDYVEKVKDAGTDAINTIKEKAPDYVEKVKDASQEKFNEIKEKVTGDEDFEIEIEIEDEDLNEELNK